MPFCSEARACGWCWLCYEGVRGRAYHRGHYGYRASRQPGWSRAMSKLVKVENVSVEAVAGQGVGSASLAGQVQTLVDFVSMTLWDDGSKRKAGSFSVFYEGGCWKSWLNDKEANKTTVVAAASLPSLLVVIEQGLASGKLDWRTPKPFGGGGRGK